MKDIRTRIQDSILRSKEDSEKIETLTDTEFFKASMSDIERYLERRVNAMSSKTEKDILSDLYDSDTSYREYKDMYDEIDDIDVSRKEKSVFLKVYDNLVDGIRSIMDKFRK